MSSPAPSLQCNITHLFQQLSIVNSVSNVTELYDDALRCILSFFTLRELHRLIQVCKKFHTAVRTLPCIDAKIDAFVMFHHALLFPDSALLHHVGHINRMTQRAVKVLNEKVMQQLCLATPSLQSLICTVNLSTSNFMFPSSRLSRLELAIDWPKAETADAGDAYLINCTHLMQTIGALQQLESLDLSISTTQLDFNQPVHRELDLTPLTMLLHLKHLTLYWLPRTLTATQAQAIRSIHSLLTLQLFDGYLQGAWSNIELLSTEGSMLQLRSLSMQHTILQDEHATSLIRFPSLTSLQPKAICTSDLNFLQSFPNLRILTLLTILETEVTLAGLLPIAAQLIELKIHSSFTEEQAQTLLAAFRSMQRLSINVHAFESLSPFKSCLPTLPLHSLTLTSFRTSRISLEVLRSLQPLHRLTTLHVLTVGTPTSGNWHHAEKLLTNPQSELFMPTMRRVEVSQNRQRIEDD